MFRSLLSACWFAFKWGLLVALIAAVGVGLFYYSRLNDEIRQRVQTKFATAYPNLRVTVHSAQLIDGQGIEVRGLAISDPRRSGPPAELAYFDEILLCCKTSLPELLEHEPKISRIIVRRPRLQAARMSDDSWSISQLLPLPKFGEHQAEILIENGEVSVFDPQRNPPATYSFHNINVSLKPTLPNPTGLNGAGQGGQTQLAQTPGGSTQNGLNRAAANQSSVETGNFEILGSLAADHVQQIEIAGQFSRATGNLDLQGGVSGIDLSPELLSALPPDLLERLKPLAPLRGLAGFNFHVARNPTQPQPWQFEVAGELANGRFDDPRLPQPLADLRAKFHADNRGFQVTDFNAGNGPTAVRLTARVEGYQAGAAFVVEGDAQHLLVGPHWEKSLPPNLLVQWEKFQPEGEININHARAVFDGQRWQLSGDVQCLNVAFKYKRFPYRLEQGEGKINLAYDGQAQQNRMTINLTAFAGSRPIKIDGVFYNPGAEFTGGVTLSGSGMPLDQNLYRAISETQPRASEVVQSLHLGGTFNFWVNCVRSDPHSPTMDQDLKVELDHCMLRYEKFPYPLYNVVGKLEMVNNLWTFRDLEGTNNTSRVTCEGSLTPRPDGLALAMEFRGHDIVLEEELRDALPPRMQQTWNDMRLKGALDLVSAQVNYTSVDKRLDVVTTVKPVGESVSLNPMCFPYRVEKVQGAVTFHSLDSRAEFDHLRGDHGNTPITLSGFCQCLPGGGWQLHFDKFTAERVRLDLDRDLLSALPARLRKTVDQLKPTGLARIQGMIDFQGQPRQYMPDGTPVAGDNNLVTQWSNLLFEVEQGTLHAGVDVQNIHGGAWFNGSYDAQRRDGSPLMCRGMLNLDSVTWNNFQFTDLRGPIWLDDRQVRLGGPAEQPEPGRAPQHLLAKCYGGAALVDATVNLTETPSYTVKAQIDNVDLNSFCTDAVPGKQKLKGRVSAGVDLTGAGGGLHTLKGPGEAHLRDADIYELPVMIRLLSVLNLKAPQTSAFSTADVKFHVDGEHVPIDSIEFVGDAISLAGRGEIDLNSDIHLALHSLVGRSDIQLPVWKTVMGGASEQLMQIQVTGNLADPKIKREALPGLNQAIQSVQAGMQGQDRAAQQGARPPNAWDETPRR